MKKTNRFREGSQLILATLVTGILAGIGSVGFHYVADRFGDILFAWYESHKAITRLPVVLALPTIGLCLVGLALQLASASRIGGVAEVLDALEFSNGVIPFRAILNVILSGFVLAFGGSVGPEGPMVQMGALVGSLVGQRLGVAKRHLQMIVRGGAAAEISAAFRSPAGV